jgi:DNA-binding transcriptional ArsR family regulator
MSENRIEQALKAADDLNEAGQKLVSLMANTNEYDQYLAKDAKRNLERLFPSKKEATKKAFAGAGRVFHLEALRINNKVCYANLDMILSFLSEEDLAKVKEIVEGAKRRSEKAMKTLAEGIRKAEELYKEIQERESLEQDNIDEPLLFGYDCDDGLKDTILGFMHENTFSGEACLGLPEDIMKYHESLDHEAVQEHLLQEALDHQTTIKEVAGEKMFTDDSRLSVAITFQAGLFLEKDGKITLSQGDGDVIIGPYAPAPDADDESDNT